MKINFIYTVVTEGTIGLGVESYSLRFNGSINCFNLKKNIVI